MRFAHKAAAGLLASILVLGGCSNEASTTESSDSVADVDAEWTYSEQPLYAAISSELGFDVEDIASASNAQYLARFNKCVVEAGFVAPNSALIDAQNQAMSAPAGEVAASLLDLLRTFTGNPPPTEALPAATFQRCDAASFESNAMTTLQALITEAEVEISDAVQVNPDYAKAVKKRDDCVASLGFDPGIAMSDAFDDDSAAMEVFSKFTSGSLDHATAMTELGVIAERRNRDDDTMSALNECGNELLLVERAIVASEQQNYLDAHPTFVSGLAENYQSTLDSLTEYLP